MKGIIFVEFIEMLDSLVGIETTEEIIEKSNLKSQGAYTIIGTYDDQEMISLINQLSIKTKIPVSELQKQFGEFLFAKFIFRYKNMLNHFGNGIQLLQHIDDYIHIEVLKLYPQAILPKFEHEVINETTLKLIYKSIRKMPDLAEGLIIGAMRHYNEECKIIRNYIEQDGSHVEFIVERIK